MQVRTSIDGSNLMQKCIFSLKIQQCFCYVSKLCVKEKKKNLMIFFLVVYFIFAHKLFSIFTATVPFPHRTAEEMKSNFSDSIVN